METHQDSQTHRGNGSAKGSSIPEIEPHNEHPSKLKALILLGGLTRQTQLSLGIERSALQLPIDGTRSLLHQWHDQAVDLVRTLSIDHLPVRIAVDQASVPPDLPDGSPLITMTLERDRTSYRGTGGVLHDLSLDYHDDDYILIANAAQLLLEPMPRLVSKLASFPGADGAIISHTHGTPSGMMFLRCGILRSVPSIGYTDLKEQVLPSLATKCDIRVVEQSSPSGIPIRTLSDYISALRVSAGGQTDPLNAFAEDWQPTFSVVEKGAQVDPNARIHDSVVLRGARVNAGSLLIRSVVCPGMVVNRNATVIDRLISPSTSNKNGTHQNRS